MNAALITGAAGGIGAALCAEFRKAGYFVAGTDRVRGKTPCDAFIRADLRAFCGKAVVRTAFRRRLIAAIGTRPLKALVNNAALQRLGPTEKVSRADWDATLETNLTAPFLMIQTFLKDLSRARGSVINIGSVHAALTKPGFVGYATSKAALAGLTRALAVDLGNRVRVNLLNPAATATPMLLAGFKGTPRALKKLGEMHPIGRIAKPREIAGFAVHLAADDASFITGACLNLDGGISGRLHDPG